MEIKLYTNAAILNLLTSIDELKDYNVAITESLDGLTQIQIGDSYYQIDPEESDITDIEVSESDLENVEDANVSAYEDLIEQTIVEEQIEPIESGLLKEIVKSLALGGLIRLGAKLLK